MTDLSVELRSNPDGGTESPQIRIEYGPFHRLQSLTQSSDVAELQMKSQEIWGRARWGSDIPQVQAYVGPLPEGERGVEFVTTVAPDPYPAPGHARWTGPREGVVVKDDFCRISVRIYKEFSVVTSFSERYC